MMKRYTFFFWNSDSIWIHHLWAKNLNEASQAGLEIREKRLPGAAKRDDPRWQCTTYLTVHQKTDQI